MKTKVLVVDDSPFMRKLISRFVEEDESLQVIGAAQNGREAVEMVRELKPHVVTLDVEMPVMNGLEALKQIMEQRPTPVVMLSSLTQEGAKETVAALQYGAVDFVAKPSGSISADLFKVKEQLLTKIKQASQMNVRTLTRRTPKVVLFTKPLARAALRTKSFDQILAIGTSTGGPKALETVITALPEGLPFPVLVVQHMPPKFTTHLAGRLNQMSSVTVVEAEDNAILQAGTVYIAPGDYHMTAVEKSGEYRVALHQQPQVNGHRPSVDTMFASVSNLTRLKRHFVIMTGMGKDGANAMNEAKKVGASSTIAESKETCVVYGMPRAAFELGCVDHVVPLDRIAHKIAEVTGL